MYSGNGCQYYVTYFCHINVDDECTILWTNPQKSLRVESVLKTINHVSYKSHVMQPKGQESQWGGQQVTKGQASRVTQVI